MDLSGQNTEMSTIRGNPKWLAPELLDVNGNHIKRARYTLAVDVYCTGLLFAFISVKKQVIGIFKRMNCKSF